PLRSLHARLPVRDGRRGARDLPRLVALPPDRDRVPRPPRRGARLHRSRLDQEGLPAGAGAGDRRGEADDGGDQELMPVQRTAEQVRRDLEAEREQLAQSVEELRSSLGEATDIAGKLRAKLPLVAGAAASAGFVLAGGVGAAM